MVGGTEDCYHGHVKRGSDVHGAGVVADDKVAMFHQGGEIANRLRCMGDRREGHYFLYMPRQVRFVGTPQNQNFCIVFTYQPICQASIIFAGPLLIKRTPTGVETYQEIVGVNAPLR